MNIFGKFFFWNMLQIKDSNEHEHGKIHDAEIFGSERKKKKWFQVFSLTLVMFLGL